MPLASRPYGSVLVSYAALAACSLKTLTGRPTGPACSSTPEEGLMSPVKQLKSGVGQLVGCPGGRADQGRLAMTTCARNACYQRALRLSIKTFLENRQPAMSSLVFEKCFDNDMPHTHGEAPRWSSSRPVPLLRNEILVNVPLARSRFFSRRKPPPYAKRPLQSRCNSGPSHRAPCSHIHPYPALAPPTGSSYPLCKLRRNIST